MKRLASATTVIGVAALCSLSAQTADAPAQTAQPIAQKRSVSMEAALAIARVALKAGMERGSDVAVVVVDQAGIPLVRSACGQWHRTVHRGGDAKSVDLGELSGLDARAF